MRAEITCRFLLALLIGLGVPALGSDSTSNQLPELVLQAGDSGVQILTYSDDGTILASAGALENTVRIWDATTGRLLRTIYVEETAKLLAFDPKGRRLAVVGVGSALAMFDVSSGERLLTGTASIPYRAGSPSPISIRFADTENALLLRYPDGRINRIDGPGGTFTKISEKANDSQQAVVNDDGTAVYFQENKLYLKRPEDAVGIFQRI